MIFKEKALEDMKGQSCVLLAEGGLVLGDGVFLLIRSNTFDSRTSTWDGDTVGDVRVSSEVCWGEGRVESSTNVDEDDKAYLCTYETYREKTGK